MLYVGRLVTPGEELELPPELAAHLAEARHVELAGPAEEDADGRRTGMEVHPG